jgi:hypothetical protein
MRGALQPDHDRSLQKVMKFGKFAFAAGAMTLGLALLTPPGMAQGPMYDRVNVNLPYTVTIGDHVLQPGEYVIQQLRDAGGGSRVLLIYSDQGMKFETSAMTIPALDINTARETKVVLHHFGPDYYFDKVWIQGKDYGYEFPLPSSVKARERERMEPVSVAANYQTTQETQTAQAPPPPPVQEQPPAQPEQAPPPPPVETTPPPPSAEREAPPEMPHTVSGWLMMMLGGSTLSGIGMMLRRRRG